MAEPNRSDLMIAGAGSASGGNYNIVKISGNGDLRGDFACSDLIVQGKAQIDGNVEASSSFISGKAEIMGDLRSDHVKVQGYANIRGDVNCKEMRIQGKTKIKGNITGEEIKIEGGTAIDGNCSAESFLVRGNFAIGGLLNAGQIDIKLHGGSRAKEIGGEKISVRKPGITFRIKKFILTSILQINIGLITEIIEGDEIYLEHTDAQIVRGNRVTVGPGCTIERVEYKDHFQCDTGAKVKNQQKL